MKRPSRFVVVALLVLLGMGCGLNIYIAHTAVLIGTKPKVEMFMPPDWTARMVPDLPGASDWPAVPEEPMSGGRIPIVWQFTDWLFLDWYMIIIDDPARFQGRPMQVNADRKPHYLESLVFSEYRYGAPFMVRSTKDLMFEKNWPNGIGTSSQHVTYHPLGLILNPIIYALPPWLLLLGARWAYITRRTHKRKHRGLCPRCAYDMNGLSVCPECGESITRPGGSACSSAT